jgi:hypothetical protein
MNEEEHGRTPPDGGDRDSSGGDSGLVQPTIPDTYRGPYGEPIVIPVTDDPAGHPEYQPGHSDSPAPRDTDARLDALPDTIITLADAAVYYANLHAREYPVTHDWDALQDAFLARHSNPGSGQPDHGKSSRRDR